MKKITISELSVLTGKSRVTITKRLAEKELKPLKKEGRKQFFDSVEALPAILQHPSELVYKDDLILSQERAKLAVQQTIRLEFKNKVEKGKYLPVEVLSDQLSRACSIIVAHLDSLPMELKKGNPSLTGKDIVIVQKLIARCRNAAANAVIEAG